MKKSQAFFVSLSILACLIVLPVIGSVNGSAGNHQTPATSLVSEGNPMPSPIPPGATTDVFIAEGNPMPSPIPPATSIDTLIAEGNPMPSPIPPKPNSVELMIA
jgi:hypothetical protein